MTTHPRLKMITYCVGIALTQWVAAPALADSAVGVDTALGNTMNPPGRSAVPRQLDTESFDSVRHSPTGQLYGVPYDLNEAPNKTDGGWEYTGGVEVGAIGGDGDKRSVLSRKYTDIKNGLYLNYFEAEADKKDTATYVQAFGGGTGRHDQFYGMQFGRYNDWKVKLFYNETQHVFSDNYKSIYNGTGTGNLTLAGGLKPNGGATPVTTGSPTVGATPLVACTAAAPCWSYGGQTYANAAALAGINWTGVAAAAPQAISPTSIAGNINNYLDTVDPKEELALVRKKIGGRLDATLTNSLKAYVAFSQEKRTGARPFGMNENNYTVELPEPIDYTTNDFLAGLQYADPLTQANLRLSASLFRNNIGTLTVEQPWLSVATAPGVIPTAIFDLYPNNDAYNVKGEVARNLPDLFHGRVTAGFAWGTMRQDDALQLPVDPTQSAAMISAFGGPIIPGINNPGYATNSLNINNWNGVNGSPLSQTSGKQRIDTKLMEFGLSLNPIDALNLKGNYRYFENDNQGGYVAYNPLTGQFGRGFVRSTSFDLVAGSSNPNGAAAGVGLPCYVLPGFPVVPGCTFGGNVGGAVSAANTANGVALAGQSTNNPANVPVFSPARDTKQTNYTLAADYNLGKGGSLNGLIEREDFKRTFRERDKTWEDRIKLGYVNRGYEFGTLRLSYEDARRRGSDYEFWPTGDFGTGLPGMDWNTIIAKYLANATSSGWLIASATNPSLAGYLARYAYESRKFDQADRDQQILNARVNVMPRQDIDLGLSLQMKNAKYPNSGFGLEKDDLTSLNIDANFQPSTEQQFYAFYSWQEGKKSLRANSGTNATGANNTCSFPAGTVLTTDQIVQQCSQAVWLVASTWNLDTKDHNDVFGAGFQTAIGKMKFGLDYTYSIGRTSVTYQYGANVLTAAQAAVAGGGWPDMTLTQNTLTAHLIIPIQKKVSAHLMYRYEQGKIKDYHYQGVPIGASAAENQATVMLDAGPQDYRNNIVGAFLQIKL